MLDVFNLLVVGLEKLWWVKSNSCWYLPRIGMRSKHLHCSTGPPFFCKLHISSHYWCSGVKGLSQLSLRLEVGSLDNCAHNERSPHPCAQFTVHSVLCTVHSAQCTVQSVHCTTHTAQYTVHGETPPPLFREDNVTLARGGSLVFKEGLSSLSKTPSLDQEMSNNYSW